MENRILLPVGLAFLLMLVGCEVDILAPPPPPPPPPPPATITIDYQWTYAGSVYSLDLEVFEEDYQDARHAHRIPHDEYYGELVSYSLGLGYAEAACVADGLYELARRTHLGSQLLPLAMRFVQQASPEADFEVGLPFHYPLESLVDGGRNSADQAIMGAALLENLGYATGIAIFWNTWGGPIHAALGISDDDWQPHDYDNLGTGWTFLEATAWGDYRPVGNRPSWLDDYDAWVVWPLWEASQSPPSPRKGGRAQLDARPAVPEA
jgi:hypothetical protein